MIPDHIVACAKAIIAKEGWSWDDCALYPDESAPETWLLCGKGDEYIRFTVSERR